MMRHLQIPWLVTLGLVLVPSYTINSWSAQQPAAGETVPVSLIVTVEAKHGKEIPVITHKEDVRAFEGKERLQVADWIALQGQSADLELLILIDEASRSGLSLQYDDLRKFMDAQPPTTAIAVGYMEYGTVRLEQNFTKDREAVAKALRIPLGTFAAGNSPYLSVSDVIKRWPESKARHAIFLVSSGIDALQPGYVDTYLDAAIEDAERGGTQVSTIYASQAGHFGHSFFRFSHGQDNLSRLAEMTGGESYFQGFNTPISFTPFLDEFAERLQHQYRLTVLIKPEKKPSSQHLKLETEVPNAELVTADRVYVPATAK